MGGKKRKNFPTVEDELSKPWCYYCERDFTDMLNLIRHQKAKHFKCDRCGRRLNTAGGLSVHMNQVHKEQLHFVENALENRKGLEVEIFGMEGIPDDIKQAHQQRVLQNFYQAEAERRKNTGNPPPGQGDPQKDPRTKPSTEELKQRLAEHRAARANSSTKTAQSMVPPSNSPSLPGQYAYGQPPYGTTSTQASSTSFSGPPATHPALVSTHLQNLPRIPPGGSVGISASAAGPGPAISVDDLIADAARKATVAKSPNESGEVASTEAGAVDRKSKKDSKAIKLIYSDNNVSPEEKRASLPRYAFVRA